MDLLAFAKGKAECVEAVASRAGTSLAGCAIDIYGNFFLKHRMSGAPNFSIELSERKANTFALVRMRTANLLPLVQPGKALYPLMTVSEGRYCAMGGGASLSSAGEVVAGVGISGDIVAQDVAILEAELESHRTAVISLRVPDNPSSDSKKVSHGERPS
jgi:uncharacterized protein GlcG (DUF336 family)